MEVGAESRRGVGGGKDRGGVINGRRVRSECSHLFEGDGRRCREDAGDGGVTPNNVEAVLQLRGSVTEPADGSAVGEQLPAGPQMLQDSPGDQHRRSFGPVLVHGVIDPHVFGDAVLGSPSSRHVNLTADGASAELLPRAGQIGFTDDLLGFVVHLEGDGIATETGGSSSLDSSAAAASATSLPGKSCHT